MKNGMYWKTNKRKVGMYLYGSTITATQYPKFVHDGKEYILPRPYKNWKPDQAGNTMLSKNDILKYLLRDIEKIVIYFLQHCDDTKKSKLALFHIARSRKHIPESHRLV